MSKPKAKKIICKWCGHSKIITKDLEKAYQQGREDAIKEVFSKIGQPNECLFNYQSVCCYPIDDCMNCPITIDEMKSK